MITKRLWPWVAQQDWEDILFIHQPVTYETLRPHVPYPVEIDTYNNMAWMSIVLFRATHSRPRFMPTVLSFPQFFQMNVRTYVQFGDERGVYFFKIHTNNSLVKTGGKWAGLPFTSARMTIKQKDEKFLFQANQLFGNPQSKLSILYDSYSENTNMHPNLLPHFLTERYAIWMIRGNTIIKAPISHTPWKLKDADISVLDSTYMPFSITKDTITHYAQFKHTLIHPFEKKGIISRL